MHTLVITKVVGNRTDNTWVSTHGHKNSKRIDMMLQRIRAALRLLYAALLTTGVVLVIAAVTWWKGYSPDFSLPFRKRWARHLIHSMGIRIHQKGIPPTFPCLLLCNHRSHIDPILLLTEVMAFPVSKAEVEKWPLLGYGAKASGILYLRRESLSSRGKTLADIRSVIRSGFPILLFPEGTTHGTPGTGPFQRGVFQLAAKEGIPIVPVAMEYPAKRFYWLDYTPFAAHFLQHFGQRRIPVQVSYGPEIRGEQALELLEKTQAWIDAELHQMQAIIASLPD